MSAFQIAVMILEVIAWLVVIVGVGFIALWRAWIIVAAAISWMLSHVMLLVIFCFVGLIGISSFLDLPILPIFAALSIALTVYWIRQDARVKAAK